MRWGGGREQVLAQMRRLSAPEQLQREDLIVQLSGGHPQEGKCAAWLEFDPQHRCLAGGVKERVDGMRSADEAATMDLELVGMLAIIDANEVMMQVDNDGHRAIWQPALFWMRWRGTFVGPEEVYEG